MAIPPSASELLESGAGSITSSGDGLLTRDVDIKSLVHSITGYAAAEEKGKQLCPLYYAGHKRNRLECRPLGGGWYEISAGYSNSAIDAYEGTGIANDEGVTVIPVSMSADTTGGTEHITQAWSDSDDPAAYEGVYPPEAPTMNGAINVSGNQVNGVDVSVPAFQWTETWLFPGKFLFEGGADRVPFLKTLHSMTAKVNSDDFRFWKAGEVLFLGGRADTSRDQTMVPVVFSFAARENRGHLTETKVQPITYTDNNGNTFETGLTETITEVVENFRVGGIEVDRKDGWDYMWISYEDDATEEGLFKKPKWVYVDRVYERQPFERLQIGQNWQRLYLRSFPFVHPMNESNRGIA